MRDLDCIGRNMHWLALGTLVATGLALAIKPAHAGCEQGVGYGKLVPGCETLGAARVAAQPVNKCFHGAWFSSDALRACTPGARFADDFKIGVHQSSTWMGNTFIHMGNAESEATLSQCFNTLQRSAELNAAQHRSGTHWFSARSLGLPRCN